MDNDIIIQDDDIESFNIYDKIIDKKDENTFIIRMSFYEVLAYTTSWCFTPLKISNGTTDFYKKMIKYFIIHPI